MEDISNVNIVPCEKSRFLKPLRMLFKQNGRDKVWDALQVHDSVVILIFNKTRNVFVFVKQFRPAVYLSCSKVTEENGCRQIKTTENPPNMGVTYELCAGIVDKDISNQRIAQAEVMEECGYQVPLESIEPVTSYRSGVGTTGALQNLYFAEVTDQMRVGAGGGVAEEGELIEVVEIPLCDGKSFITDMSYNKPVAMMYALMWFFDVKAKHYLNGNNL
ncbi:uridine diphosphate glucose pyrophosphatase NUDT14-like [Ylistrum balloti]|uniref:uridine diphosphate glucose pyrophosphatase NUDT14-like n=1 Tax=Ylistrum balloti TaxID=509963 RepID=UPI002905D10D|nr:uridine diphosphate glucose pyrophosphatase NUDT14-like [Ylistrum balloti]